MTEYLLLIFVSSFINKSHDGTVNTEVFLMLVRVF